MSPALFSVVLFAAQPSTVDKIKRIPSQVWLNLLIWIVAIIIIVRLWRALKQINDYAPYILATFTGAVLFLTMVYYRNEPPFLTPVVEKLTNFFPTKSKQQTDLQRMRESRER